MKVKDSYSQRGNFKQLTSTDRVIIETLYNQNYSYKAIAKYLGVDLSTIYRELQRNSYEDYHGNVIYDAAFAVSRTLTRSKNKGAQRKINSRKRDVMNLIKIVKENNSPQASIIKFKIRHKRDAPCCARTLYNYAKDHTEEISTLHLPYGFYRTRKSKKYLERARQSSIGISIDQRHDAINKRLEFGHWEGDLICGKKNQKDASILTLVERKTRFLIAVKVPSQSPTKISQALDSIELKYRDQFRKIFKSVTFDNGLEFSEPKRLQQSIMDRQNKKRFELYYAHPYCSYERGTNEVTNRFIRRFIPKGTLLKDISQQEIDEVVNFINTYPRKILGWSCSYSDFSTELKRAA